MINRYVWALLLCSPVKSCIKQYNILRILCQSQPMASKVGWDSLAKIQFGRIHSGGFHHTHFFATEGGAPNWPSWPSLRNCSFSLAILTGGPNWPFRCLRVAGWCAVLMLRGCKAKKNNWEMALTVSSLWIKGSSYGYIFNVLPTT